MNWLQSSRVNCATVYALAESTATEYPLIYLAEFAPFLREIGWSESEVAEVEKRVAAELAHLRVGRSNAQPMRSD